MLLLFAADQRHIFLLFLEPRDKRKASQRNLYCLLEIRVEKIFHRIVGAWSAYYLAFNNFFYFYYFFQSAYFNLISGEEPYHGCTDIQPLLLLLLLLLRGRYCQQHRESVNMTKDIWPIRAWYQIMNSGIKAMSPGFTTLSLSPGYRRLSIAVDSGLNVIHIASTMTNKAEF